MRKKDSTQSCVYVPLPIFAVTVAKISSFHECSLALDSQANINTSLFAMQIFRTKKSKALYALEYIEYCKKRSSCRWSSRDSVVSVFRLCHHSEGKTRDDPTTVALCEPQCLGDFFDRKDLFATNLFFFLYFCSF